MYFCVRCNVRNCTISGTINDATTNEIVRKVRNHVCVAWQRRKRHVEQFARRRRRRVYFCFWFRRDYLVASACVESTETREWISWNRHTRAKFDRDWESSLKNVSQSTNMASRVVYRVNVANSTKRHDEHRDVRGAIYSDNKWPRLDSALLSDSDTLYRNGYCVENKVCVRAYLSMCERTLKNTCYIVNVVGHCSKMKTTWMRASNAINERACTRRLFGGCRWR